MAFRRHSNSRLPLIVSRTLLRTKQKLNSSKIKLVLRSKYSAKLQYVKVLTIFITVKSCAEQNGAQTPRQPRANFFSAVYRLRARSGPSKSRPKGPVWPSPVGSYKAEGPVRPVSLVKSWDLIRLLIREVSVWSEFCEVLETGLPNIS